MVLDPAAVPAIRSLVDLGVAGILVAGFVLVLTGRLRVGTLVDKRDADYRQQIADVVTERNEWRLLAQTAIAKVDRLTDVLEASIGRKLE